MKLLHKDLDFQVRQVGSPEDRTLEFIGSTATVDRYGDIIEPSGWDLKNYMKNPVFLWGHDYSMPPIGKAVNVKVADDALVFQVQFATAEEYAFADTIYRLYLGGFLKATSVGFQDLEREPIIDKKNEGRQTGWRFLKQELYELSSVTVPANPDAIMMAVQKGIITEKEADPILTAIELEKKVADRQPKLTTIEQRFVALGRDLSEVVSYGKMAELVGLDPNICQVEDIAIALYLRGIDLQAELSEKSKSVKFDLVFSEEQLEKIRADLELKAGIPPEIKAGAVLSAKNKTALKNAQAMIQQVLDAAEPAPVEEEEGKAAIHRKASIYSLALNPGTKPNGERLAEEGINMAEIFESTKKLKQLPCLVK